MCTNTFSKTTRYNFTLFFLYREMMIYMDEKIDLKLARADEKQQQKMK